MATKRTRPSITVTIDPGIHGRLRALVERLPGATLSHLLDELLGASLPLYEDLADSMDGARDEDGVVDDKRALRAFSAAIGVRVGKAIAESVHDTPPELVKGGEVTT